MVGLGHIVMHAGGAVELFLTLALNTPTYSAAYHDGASAAVEGYGSPACQMAQAPTRRVATVRACED